MCVCVCVLLLLFCRVSRPQIPPSLPPSFLPSTSYLRSCQSRLQRCRFGLSGWGTCSDQPWTLIDLSGEMTAASEDARRQVHVMWQDSFIPAPPPPPPLPKNKYPRVGSWKSAQGMSMFPDELRETFLLSLSGCDAARRCSAALQRQFSIILNLHFERYFLHMVCMKLKGIVLCPPTFLRLIVSQVKFKYQISVFQRIPFQIPHWHELQFVSYIQLMFDLMFLSNSS